MLKSKLAVVLLFLPLGLVSLAQPVSPGQSGSSGQSSANPSPSATRVLKGSVRYHKRVALPDDAAVHVIIQEILADGTAKALAEQDIPTKGHQMPIKFAVKFDPAAIDASHRYEVVAKITSGGRLMFTSTNTYPVLTQGAPADNLAIDLEQVSAQYGQLPSGQAVHTPLTDTQWNLAEVDGKAPQNDSPQAYIKLIGKTERVEGSGGCNRLMGSYSVEGRELHFKEMGSTMMACMGDVATMERAFLAALNTTESYRIRGSTLTLLGKGAKVLARLEAQDTTAASQP